MDVEGGVGEDGAVKDVAREVEERGHDGGVEAFLGNGILEGLQAGDVVLVNGLLGGEEHDQQRNLGHARGDGDIPLPG